MTNHPNRSRNMTYSIIIDDDHTAISSTTSEGARRAGIKAARDYPGSRVYVTFYRASDGQVGYVNRDGSHAITGSAY